MKRVLKNYRSDIWNDVSDGVHFVVRDDVWDAVWDAVHLVVRNDVWFGVWVVVIKLQRKLK